MLSDQAFHIRRFLPKVQPQEMAAGLEGGREINLMDIEAFEKKIEEELPYLLHAKTTLNEKLNEDNAHKYYLLTVEFGIKTYQTYLEWCKEARKLLAGGQ